MRSSCTESAFCFILICCLIPCFSFPFEVPVVEVPVCLKSEEVSRVNQNQVCFSLVNTYTAPRKCLPTLCGRFIFSNCQHGDWSVSPHTSTAWMSHLGWYSKAWSGGELVLWGQGCIPPLPALSFLHVDFFLSSYFLFVIFAFFFYTSVCVFTY